MSPCLCLARQGPAVQHRHTSQMGWRGWVLTQRTRVHGGMVKGGGEQDVGEDQDSEEGLTFSPYVLEIEHVVLQDYFEEFLEELSQSQSGGLMLP
jgi:hypothetical protein